MARFYYSAAIGEFLQHSDDHVLGALARNSDFAVENTQRNAWLQQIGTLKRRLNGLSDGHLIFEYTIPRIGRRIDNVLLYNGLVFLLEFKVGDSSYQSYAIEQVMDYALDLKNFHKESHARTIVPMLIATKAHAEGNRIFRYPDGIVHPLLSNGRDLSGLIAEVCERFVGDPLVPQAWENSIYSPTPTIIEAAQALYRGHNVANISRSDASAENLTTTTQAINRIVERAKSEKLKCICFVTGVPGAGKTLAGLNIANERHHFDEDEHAVFLSGNGPLVAVLQEALARNDIESTTRTTKREALAKSKAFIQNIHHFRDDALDTMSAPIERVAIFDEAQRAWTREQTSGFMERKRGLPDFEMSEPEFLLSVMDRHSDWAVVVCLVGGGQEINTGEAGLPEWFASLRRRFPGWNVYLSDRLSDVEYTRGASLSDLLEGLQYEALSGLHLSVSLRSFRSERVSDLVKAIVDGDLPTAQKLYAEVRRTYPIMLTRDISRAKRWIRDAARGSERYGLVASSGSARLRPYGIWTQCKVDACCWFLNDRYDIRSSYYLEEAATEFDIQGLELDWALMAWDADYRFCDGQYVCRDFSGSTWRNVKSPEKALYLKNAYRVLLTRARQGMVVFVPKGDDDDRTRKQEFYDGTFAFLSAVGLAEL